MLNTKDAAKSVKSTMSFRNSKKRIFECLILKKFSNFETAKKRYVIADKIPLPEDVELRDNESMLSAVELHGAEWVVR